MNILGIFVLFIILYYTNIVNGINKVKSGY